MMNWGSWLAVSAALCSHTVIAASNSVETDPSGAASICTTPSGALTAVRGPCPTGTASLHIASVNIFDQLWVGSSGMDTCCNATGGPATYVDAKAALLLAHTSGIRVFRFFASLFGGSQAFWIKNPATFWFEFDRLIDDIEALGMYAIPSLGTGMWHEVANVVTPGLNETLNDNIQNTTSAAYKLNLEYFDQVTKRYAGRKCVLAWELGNELNLHVSLPIPSCGPKPCFNTAEMVQYETALVSKIRETDPVRPVSSGHSMPRASAWHQEHCGSGVTTSSAPPAPPGCDGGYWGSDTKEQYVEMFAWQSSAVEMWSVHHYASDANASPCFFGPAGTLEPGPKCAWNASLIQVVAAAAAQNSKMLYVGEYGGANPDFTGPSVANQSFNQNVLDLQVADSKAGGTYSLSTIWAWACPSHRADMVCIWPGSSRAKELGSDKMIADIHTANTAMSSQ